MVPCADAGQGPKDSYRVQRDPRPPGLLPLGLEQGRKPGLHPWVHRPSLPLSRDSHLFFQRRGTSPRPSHQADRSLSKTSSSSPSTTSLLGTSVSTRRIVSRRGRTSWTDRRHRSSGGPWALREIGWVSNRHGSGTKRWGSTTLVGPPRRSSQKMKSGLWTATERAQSFPPRCGPTCPHIHHFRKLRLWTT